MRDEAAAECGEDATHKTIGPPTSFRGACQPSITAPVIEPLFAGGISRATRRTSCLLMSGIKVDWVGPWFREPRPVDDLA